MKIPPNGPKRPPQQPSGQAPSAEVAREKPKTFGRHYPGRNVFEAAARLTGQATPDRTLAQAGLGPDRLQQVASQLDNADLPGVDGRDAEVLVRNKSREHLAKITESANSFGHNASLRSFAGNGFLVRSLVQGATALEAPDPAVTGLKRLGYGSSVSHGASAAAAAADASHAKLVLGANGIPVSKEEVSASFVPFGQRFVKDLATAKTLTLLASELDLVPQPAAQLGGSLLGFAASQRAAKKTAMIVAARQAGNHYSAEIPLIENGTVVGSKLSHPIPEARPDGRVELGRIEVFDENRRISLAVHRPSEHGPSIDFRQEADVAQPETRGFRRRTRDFLKALPETVPTSSTAAKLGAQVAGQVTAGAVSRLAKGAITFALMTANAPAGLASGVTKLGVGIAADAAFASVFLPGFMRFGKEARTPRDAIGKVAAASTPIVNYAFDRANRTDTNAIFDDATFGLSASSETEMLAVLSREIPGSVGYNSETGSIELDGFDAIRSYAPMTGPFEGPLPDETEDRN